MKALLMKIPKRLVVTVATNLTVTSSLHQIEIRIFIWFESVGKNEKIFYEE